ncbi:hypothetical protein GCM10027176_06560 [Actinoallomurus bryophytorum]|uniref:mRNA-degrading endonuclease RelE of RelBE toxin-antitoxin system n=1 Tax=Actinoallomurus bryophytorum TaxID=1490222 RepID=A0A543CPH0_9ACTN|nr:hypothetical protein [Actinoallomurus bryophytorum]TQL98837.1 hypothetical protein FB559_4471 [Actinoallomurus bryophytorum]
MTYKFDGFHGRALYELNGLPEHVRNGPLVERLLQLLESPWDAVPERPGQSMVRHAFFGEDDQGMLTFVVHDQTETLRIVDILWVG